MADNKDRNTDADMMDADQMSEQQLEDMNTDMSKADNDNSRIET